MGSHPFLPVSTPESAALGAILRHRALILEAIQHTLELKGLTSEEERLAEAVKEVRREWKARCWESQCLCGMPVCASRCQPHRFCSTWGGDVIPSERIRELRLRVFGSLSGCSSCSEMKQSANQVHVTNPLDLFLLSKPRKPREPYCSLTCFKKQLLLEEGSLNGLMCSILASRKSQDTHR